MPASGKFELSFTPTGHQITIDGVNADVTHDVGDNDTPIEIGSGNEGLVFNWGVKGYFTNFVISNNGTPAVSYAGTDGAATLTESVEGANGVISGWPTNVINPNGTWGAFTPEIVGFRDIPDYTKNFYIPPVTASPFTDLSLDLTDTPTDSDRAYMQYKDTGNPILLDAGDASFPNWSAIPIANMERNPNCWYYKKPMTCFTVQSEFYGYAGHIIALSPRHGIIAEHVRDDFPSTWQDKKFWFMDMNNTAQELQGLDYENLTGLDTTDITVVLFDEPLTLDVDYATFMTDTDSNAYDSRDVTAVGPSKEGIFSIETESQMCSVGLRYPIESQPEFEWSRWNNPSEDWARIGDSSSPTFFYNDTTLYYMFSALSKTHYAWDWTDQSGSGDNSVSIANRSDRGYNNPTVKTAIKTAMDALDLRNGGLQNYNLVEVAI